MPCTVFGVSFALFTREFDRLCRRESGQSNQKCNLRNQRHHRWLLRHTKQTADEETREYFTNFMRDVDLLAFGRKTYQLMVPYWPEVAKNQSETKTPSAKLFFSRSLDSAEDKNTRIVRTNLHDEILKLKQEQGKNILIGGVSEYSGAWC